MLLVISIIINCILGTLLILYRRQIKEICRQVAFLRKEETNMLVTTDLSMKEILKLAEEINGINEKGKRTIGEYRNRDAQLKEIFTSLSHDIRTPLTSMDGYLQLLESSEKEEERKRYTKIISGRVDALKVMLEELFMYTKIQNMEYKVELQKENMKQIVFESVIAFYEEFKAKEIEPVIELCEQSVSVLCNKELLGRVIQNIVKNSLVHGEDYVSIALFIKEKEVIFVCKNKVEDPDQIEATKLFERFYKADAARSVSSSGLGLAIAKGLTEKMGGKIEAKVENEEFEIVLRFQQV